MHIRWISRWKILTKKCLVLTLIVFTAASVICFVLLNEDSINERLQLSLCQNGNKNWIHYNRTYVNQKILVKLKHIHISSSIYKADFKWQEAIPHVFIYSAFNDSCHFPGQDMPIPCIKIVSITLRSHSVFEDSEPQLVCFIKNRNSIEYSTSIKYTAIKEHHGRCFGAAFIDCRQTYNQAYPVGIALGKSADATPLNWIPVNRHEPRVRDLAACVRPLYGPFNFSLQLLEFIIYYSEIGVEHFYFYDQSVVPEIYHLLELVSRYGKANITILQWKFPLDNELVHENGQLAHVQDCILRCRNEFKHVILVDIDEYIVPRQQNNLVEMLSYLDGKYNNAGTYIFPMALFCDEYLYQAEQINASLPFITHINIWRQKTLWYYQERSKVIVKPYAVKIGAIHFTWEHVENYREIWTPANIAIVQHYRSCCGMKQTWILHLLSFNVLDDRRIEDKSILAHKISMSRNPLVKLLVNLLNDTLPQ